MKFILSPILIVIVLLSGCATNYQNGRGTMTGGWYEKHMEGEIYRVTFSANGYTSRETAQTYWLYRCAELTIEKGRTGFEILSQITLTETFNANDFFNRNESIKKAQYYVPIYIDESNKPQITADIRLLNGEIESTPPKIFDARALKGALEPYVNGEKCSMGNVCEHVHKYLHPAGKFESKL